MVTAIMIVAIYVLNVCDQSYKLYEQLHCALDDIVRAVRRKNHNTRTGVSQIKIF